MPPFPTIRRDIKSAAVDGEDQLLRLAGGQGGTWFDPLQLDKEKHGLGVGPSWEESAGRHRRHFKCRHSWLFNGGWGGGGLNGSSQSQLALAKTIPLAHIQNGVFETGWGAAVHEHGGLEYLAEKKTQGLGGGASAPLLRSLIPIQEHLKTKKSVLKKK